LASIPRASWRKVKVLLKMEAVGTAISHKPLISCFKIDISQAMASQVVLQSISTTSSCQKNGQEASE